MERLRWKAQRRGRQMGLTAHSTAYRARHAKSLPASIPHAASAHRFLARGHVGLGESGPSAEDSGRNGGAPSTVDDAAMLMSRPRSAVVALVDHAW